MGGKIMRKLLQMMNYKNKVINERKAPMKKTILTLMIVVMLLLTMGAFAQSDSRYDAGLNLPFNQKAGDVNPQTGNLGISVIDLSLPGRAGMDFSFSRVWSLKQSNAYNMNQSSDDGHNYLSDDTPDRFNHLGTGWNASLPYIFSLENAPSSVKNLFFGGNVYELDTNHLDDNTNNESHIKGYDLLDLRVYSGIWGSDVSYGDFETETGLSILNDLPAEITDTTTDLSEYVLILKDNSRYYFRSGGKLMMRQDRSGLNRIWYFYEGTGDDTRLRLVVDTVGRFIHFTYNGNGNLDTISWDVQIGQKLSASTREYATVTRTITYHYIDAEATYPEVAGLMSGDQETYLLSGITDVAGNLTSYDYQPCMAQYSFDASRSEDTNAYLMLSSITTIDDGSGGFRNQRHFEYQLTNENKEFYLGFMEFYKISRQYMVDINGRIIGDTSYEYFEPRASYPYNEYSTDITVGNVTTTYVYTHSSLDCRNQVLDRVKTVSKDGFLELVDYTYNNDRAIIQADVDKQGEPAYSDMYTYDKKGNLTQHTDCLGLKTFTDYDETYSIPVEEIRTLDVDGVSVDYKTTQTIDENDLVIEQFYYEFGKTTPVRAAFIEYDSYGNIIRQTDALDHVTHTEYDANHIFPVKTWQSLTIKDWSDKTANGFWIPDPDIDPVTTEIRTWKVFNTDGTVWMEVDNEGYTVEHYYDAYGREIETIMPNGDDELGLIDDNPDPITDLYTGYLETNLTSYFNTRGENPGIRIYIDYQHDFMYTVADVDKSSGIKKVSSVQNDGLGNTLEEAEYKVLALSFDETNIT